ncbi:hypothetical protein HMPREF0201_03130 [Cedecea davisae DSM 4568]|uniref:Uncharacterized protein n=1 Tax=Cedecea davisae DSM 4568 TaxID=566551 RepID=S3IQ61_9ENTR|nr:hypothetical protein HMPREF0201_03130 [Cedecea davisae DSM 4568]
MFFCERILVINARIYCETSHTMLHFYYKEAKACIERRFIFVFCSNLLAIKHFVLYLWLNTCK